MTVGTASGLGWLVFVLLLVPALPILWAIAVLGGRGGREGLIAFGGFCLRLFFVRFLGAIRFHRVAERPAPARVRELAPCVFAANHRSQFDGLLALALFPGVRLPVNAAYLRIPVVGSAIRWSGCIPFDRSSAASALEGVRASREALAAGYSLFVFPEGTRGGDRGVRAFQDLFFRLAVEAQVPVVPVVLHSDTLALAPDAPGFLPWRRASWTVRLQPPLPADPRDRPADLARRARAGIGEELAALDG